MSDFARTVWCTTSPWAGLAHPGRFGSAEGDAGVRIQTIAQATVATLIVRQGLEADFRRILREEFACDVPPPGRASLRPDVTLVWSGSGQWLAMAARDTAFCDLPTRLAGTAAVTDQSDSRGLLAISGPRVREMLQKGFAVDLHPSAFQVGSAAVTKVAHIAVQIWQIDDAPRYMIAVPRSFLGSFWSWLTAACAEYGYEVAKAGRTG